MEALIHSVVSSVGSSASAISHVVHVCLFSYDTLWLLYQHSRTQ